MNLLVYLAVFVSFYRAGAIWNRFDLVRNRTGAWGSNSTVSFVKITQANTIPSLPPGANFGWSVAKVGDIDGNGFDDIAVGAPNEGFQNSTTGEDVIGAGAVYILFMEDMGIVRNYSRLGHQSAPKLDLSANDQFGYSVAGMGDLDGDGVPDVVVGAPGYIISSAYILYMHSNGSIRNYTLIRGEYSGTLPEGVNSTNFNLSSVSDYAFNGPPITYGCRFATALSNIGDVNGDGVTDLAVTSVSSRVGVSTVYFLHLSPNGTVISFTIIVPRMQHPEFSLFSAYGRSVMGFPDLNNDNVSEAVVGAPLAFETGSYNPNAGELYFNFMFPNSTVRNTTIISETSMGKFIRGSRRLPYMPYDECGTSLAFIGDINKDRYKQRRPWKLSPERSVSIPDIIMGCPQSRTPNGRGRIFFVYLNSLGEVVQSTPIPALTDDDTILPYLSLFDQFGASVAGYNDMDKNGIPEILVGAPGDDTGGSSTGALYMLFVRRRRHFWVPFDFLTFILIVTLVPGIMCCLCVWGVIYFFWYFRRIPDEAEIVIKKAGLEIGKRKTKPVYMKKGGESKVYVDHYTL
eukprot:gene36046-43714_t